MLEDLTLDRYPGASSVCVCISDPSGGSGMQLVHVFLAAVGNVGKRYEARELRTVGSG
jgi:hypothetical protein